MPPAKVRVFTVTSAVNVIVPLLTIAVSLAPGTAAHDHFVESFQLPRVPFHVQVASGELTSCGFNPRAWLTLAMTASHNSAPRMNHKCRGFMLCSLFEKTVKSVVLLLCCANLTAVIKRTTQSCC